VNPDGLLNQLAGAIVQGPPWPFRKDLPSAAAGGKGLVGLAPAVGNAIFAASGIRRRNMPMAPQNGVPREPDLVCGVDCCNAGQLNRGISQTVPARKGLLTFKPIA
jgi:hypothetical protein